ncbi:hypothetical protein CSC81_06740 [Tenacibaculum discolor]|uniref:DUF4294 domain-containing protein n=1 Tax=Tenacibaculum discolor TaxID=361581 RepID=A0A2G1BWY1_9FLAO|nr:hypothetical protein CSC81_06740 [Tenacibaculum discolor]
MRSGSLLIFLFLVRFNFVFAQANDSNQQLVVKEICDCLDNKKGELTVKYFKKCKKKVFRKNKAIINLLVISRRKKVPNLLQKLAAGFGVENELLINLFKSCKRFEEFAVKRKAKILNQEFIDKTSHIICEKIEGNKTKYYNFWEASSCVDEYFYENVDSVVRLLNFKFYNKKQTPQESDSFMKFLISSVRKKLRKECQYFKQLEDDIIKNKQE